jgi:hypothetical protein
MLDPRAAAAREIQPLLDGLGWASLAADFLIALITFFTSYDHVDLFGIFQFKVHQQSGIPLLLATMAALFGEVKLASNDRCEDQSARKRVARAREREADEADRERHRAAEEKGALLVELNSKLDALLLSADSSSPAPPATDSN